MTEQATGAGTGLRAAITLVALLGMILTPLVFLYLSIQETGIRLPGAGSPTPEQTEAAKHWLATSGGSAILSAIAIWVLTGIRAQKSSRNGWEIFLSVLAVPALLLGTALMVLFA
jgi:hypothetical protein